MRLPADLVLLSRALVTLDGTLRVLVAGPSLVVGDGADGADRQPTPVVDPRASRPRRAARRAAAPAPPARAGRPHPHADRPGRAAPPHRRRRGRPPHPAHARQPRPARRHRRGRSSSSATVLLVAADAGPAVAGATGLFEIFGYGGLLAGTVLVAPGRRRRRPGRHDMTTWMEATMSVVAHRAPSGGRPASTTGRPASATTGIPATSCASCVWGAATLVAAPRLDRGWPRDQRRRARPTSGGVDGARRRRGAASCCWRWRRSAPSSCPSPSSLVLVGAAAVAPARLLVVAGRGSPARCLRRSWTARLDLAGPAARRRRRRHLAGVDPLPVARLPRRRWRPPPRSASRGCRGRGGAPTDVAAGRARS